MTYTLIIGESSEGPYTRQECRQRVEEVCGGDWHWEPQADGSQLAKRPDGNQLAEAVPIEA